MQRPGDELMSPQVAIQQSSSAINRPSASSMTTCGARSMSGERLIADVNVLFIDAPAAKT